jgi:hypothetical protein
MNTIYFKRLSVIYHGNKKPLISFYGQNIPMEEIVLIWQSSKTSLLCKTTQALDITRNIHNTYLLLLQESCHTTEFFRRNLEIETRVTFG